MVVIKTLLEKLQIKISPLLLFCFQVLDRLLLYLRIVHSVDYYNTCEYPSEDEMPNRCGMIHVRGPVPPNRVTHGEGWWLCSYFNTVNKNMNQYT